MWKCKCEVTYESMLSKTLIKLPITFTSYYWSDNDTKTDMLFRVADEHKPKGYTVRAISLISAEKIDRGSK